MKKYIVTGLVMMLCICSLAQTRPCQINIKLNGLKVPAKAYLITQYGWTDSRVIDSAVFKNGDVKFKSQTAEPFKAQLLVGNSPKWSKTNDALLLYVDQGNIAVNGTDSVKNAVISGSEINKQYLRYRATVLAPVEKTSKEVNAAFTAAGAEKKKGSQFMAEMTAKLKQAVKVSDSLKYIYIRQNPSSFLSLEALSELAGKNPNITLIEPLFKKLDVSLRNMPKGKKLAEILYDNGSTGIGALAPVFTEPDVNGNNVSLTDFRGKYVLLDFWASWCGPCRAENPNVLKVYNKYKDKNFTVLGISLDQPGKKNAWLAAIKQDGLPWTQVSDLNYWNNAAARLYGVQAIPQNFLIDPSGKIIAKNLRGDALEITLAKFIR
ncbi:peroxiredoxin [Mucilaginibacter gracilis]|uniref:Alkyl hydroperoxide reductase/ Thiol specific antioxidant/ Mal allergen n=2 Tax=Mucilaginibacter TaxID=423349 RepID=H1YGZ9_9SPHI|nr:MULTISPECIES: TlpA disulfide reductase family protein [Mucilaginibacter]EHQ27408.1 alkyl hydroperoxide reductase/ Thiol specific antioxidant/ Mal allergen [Mucilaginibacter paludis DSM 18603]RKR80973.1 peroxiredoxin [Mucilaginibacter gracilis]